VDAQQDRIKQQQHNSRLHREQHSVSPPGCATLCVYSLVLGGHLCLPPRAESNERSVPFLSHSKQPCGKEANIFRPKTHKIPTGRPMFCV
jgi:hypothetical protein